MSEPDKQARDRKHPLKVVVSPQERQQITGRAQACGLSVSAYLRHLGLGYEPQSLFDQDAILSLVKLHADQGRLGGLLKLWLSERQGEGAPATDVRSVLQQIESLQMALARLVMREGRKRR